MADIDYEKRLKVYRSKEQNIYLMPSPYEADGGEKIGKVPTAVPLHDLRVLDYPESPIKAIREKCIDCSGGNAAEVRKCPAVACVLWPFRMGHNPFWGKPATDTPPVEAPAA